MKTLITLLLFIFSVQDMSISDRGAYMIGYFEGFSSKAYWDQYGEVWTIGYGHTGDDVYEGKTITEQEGLELLKNDLRYMESFVNNVNFVPQSLNQAQFDALVSFAYNLGPYALPGLCKGKTMKEIAKDILQYCHAGGVELPGLVKRRRAESNLILYGNTGIGEINSKY